jgi:hypothetical protein
MGRYYTGDIEGKFAFGVQASDAADQFGVEGQKPQYLEYYFSTDHISEVKARLTELEESFGEYKTSILAYIDLFGCKPYEQDIPLSIYLERAGMKLLKDEKLENYFDYNLGRQILQCIEEEGECSFSAEL